MTFGTATGNCSATTWWPMASPSSTSLPTGDVTPHKVRPGAKIVDGTVTYPGQPTLFDL